MVNVGEILRINYNVSTHVVLKILYNYYYNINIDNIKIDTDLLLQRINNLKLPNNLHIDGYLDLYGSDINKLPKNLIVNGDLDIQNTNIKSLPKSLIVKGRIIVSGGIEKQWIKKYPNHDIV